MTTKKRTVKKASATDYKRTMLLMQDDLMCWLQRYVNIKAIWVHGGTYDGWRDSTGDEFICRAMQELASLGFWEIHKDSLTGLDPHDGQYWRIYARPIRGPLTNAEDGQRAVQSWAGTIPCPECQKYQRQIDHRDTSDHEARILLPFAVRLLRGAEAIPNNTDKAVIKVSSRVLQTFEEAVVKLSGRDHYMGPRL